MATADYIISNQSGASFRTDLNNTLAAIVSNNSNSSEPATKYAYQWWADTSAGVMKLRNSANDGWIELFQLDGTLTLEDGSASSPALSFRDDLNTGIFSSAADHIEISAGGVARVSFGTAGVAFNDDGNDYDFRIEGDTEQNLFFIDAANDRVGIGNATPVDMLNITVTTDGEGITLSAGNVKPMFVGNANRSAENNTIVGLSGEWNGTEVGRVAVEAGADTTNKDDGLLTFHTRTSGSGLTKRMTIDTNGNVGIAEATPTETLHVGGAIRTSGRVGVGTAPTHANIVSYVTASGSYPPTGGMVQANNDDSTAMFWNGDNSANYVGFSLECRTSGASYWLIANVYNSSFNGDLAFRTRSGGSSNAEIVRFLRGGGITFNGDTAAANALDDYEEGTFTLSLGGTWTSNPTSLAGGYVKIGRIVHIFANFAGGSKSSSTSGYFEGLPFATTNYGTGAVVDSNVAGQGQCLFFNTDRIWMTDTSFNSTTYITGQYTTDA